MSFEFTFLDFIQSNMRSGIGDVLMPLITRLGDSGLLWFAAGVLALLFPNGRVRRAGGALLLALIIEVVICNGILKPFVARPRPCDFNTAVQLLVTRPGDFSFPSGHTGAAFAAASALYFSRCRWWRPAAALAVLIAFSRLYLYLHFPTDVLAGAMIGILTGWLGKVLSDRLAAALEKRGRKN